MAAAKWHKKTCIDNNMNLSGLLSMVFVCTLVEIVLPINPNRQIWYCDTKEKLKEINKMVIKRVLVNMDTVYIFYRSKVFIFQIPITNVQRTEHADATYLMKPPLYLSDSFDEIDYNFEHIRPSVYTDPTAQTTYEIVKNESDYKFYEVSYEHDKLGKRILVSALDRRMEQQIKKLVLINRISNEMDLALYQTVHYKSQAIDIIGVTYKGNQSIHSMYKDYQVSNPTTDQYQTKLRPGVEFAAFVYFDNSFALYYNESKHRIDVRKHILDDKRPERHKLRLNKIEISQTGRTIQVSEHEFYSGNKHFELQVKFEDFFMCIHHFDDEQAVKGILYKQEFEMFFVFINNYYLAIPEHEALKEDRFELFFRYDRILNYTFASGSSENDMVFETLDSKWIKIREEEAFFVPLFDLYVFYVTNDSLNKQLLFRQIAADPVNRCRKQTLQIKKTLYCFDKNAYYPIWDYVYNKPIEGEHYAQLVENLFNHTNAKWEMDSVVLLIFNYKDQFAFVTYEHVFFIPYKATGDSVVQFIVLDADVKVKKIKHNLFRNRPQWKTTMPTGPTETKENKINHLILIGLSVFIFVLNLILVAFVIYLKAQRKSDVKAKFSKSIRNYLHKRRSAKFDKQESGREHRGTGNRKTRQ